MKVKKILIVLAIMIIIMEFMVIQSYAATFNLDVSFNGKDIKMTSEQEEININTANLLPGESENSQINFSNIGNEKVILYMTTKITEGEEFLDILKIVIKDGKGKEIFSGKYSEFQKAEIVLPKGEKESYTIITSMPEETGNEYQNKQANIKITFEANGQEIVVETPKTNQSKIIIYAVLIAIVLILTIILIKLTVNKKK